MPFLDASQLKQVRQSDQSAGYGRPLEVMTITNLVTHETMEAQFNPSELQEQLAVNFTDLDVLGLSHQPTQYKNTSNQSFDLELMFSATSPRSLVDIEAARKFLLAACYAPRGASGVSGGAPPRLQFVWPEVVSMQCTLRALSTTFQQFNIKGRPIRWTTKLKLVEIRDARLTGDDVRDTGTIRTAGKPPQPAAPNVITIPEVTIVGEALGSGKVTIGEVTIVGTPATSVANVTIPKVTQGAAQKPFVPRKGPKAAPPVYTLPVTVIEADAAPQVYTLSETVITDVDYTVSETVIGPEPVPPVVQWGGGGGASRGGGSSGDF